ncbi:MAG: hypothetical protein M1837_001111 [Sclerophora amabilis]|nr:MAG: hypothetical protein M1837_001111 [Sclerophora amabilis]
METANLTASWASAIVTTIGLGGIMTQAGAIRDQLDPFHSTRSVEHLGTWVSRQVNLPWYSLAKPPPVGPVITAKLTTGFCDLNEVWMSRVPMGRVGAAGWTVLLAILHPEPLPIQSLQEKENLQQKTVAVTITESPSTYPDSSSSSWKMLRTRPLVRCGATACAVISRTSLITLMVVTNARCIFKFSEAAGLRAAYASYSGLWHIEWPLGGPPIVHFSAHDSHSAASDVYPPAIPRRVDKCIEMLAGIITADRDGSSFKIAFPGRAKQPGHWMLEEQKKGYPGAHGSRHLYNMMGGKVFEVDMLFKKSISPFERNDLGVRARELLVPSLAASGQQATLLVREHEQETLQSALDHLPWTALSWSIHRGLKDILCSFGRNVMDRYRPTLAATIKNAVRDHPQRLERRGWDRDFINDSIGDMAASAILSGGGDSGDLVRVTTDVALLLWDGTAQQLDRTTSWRSPLAAAAAAAGVEPSGSDPKVSGKLDPDTVIALIKYFVLEWSSDIDYQMYHELPMELLFG